MAWAGFNPAAATQDGSAEQAFLELFGYDLNTPIGEIAAVTKAEFEDELANFKVADKRPSLAVRTRAKQTGHAARVFGGTEYSIYQVQERAEAEAAHAAKLLELKAQAEVETAKAAATAAAATTAPPPVAATPAPVGRTVRLKDIVDVCRHDEAVVIAASAMDDARQHYRKMMHGPVPQADMPTAEQLTALQVLLKEGVAPAVDFGIWGPYAGRIMRALTFRGMILGDDLSLRNHGMKGPPTFEHWSACWAVFQAAMIILDACDPPHLVAYARHIQNFSRTYGPACWALIYQAEWRFRREQMQRMREDETDLKKAALQAGGNTEFNADRPWNTVFQKAVGMYAYWHENVETHALMIVSSARSTTHFLDGDSAIAGSAGDHIATQQAPYVDIGIPAQAPAHTKPTRPPPSNTNPQPKKKTKPTPVHNVVNGQHTTNRRGAPLCAAFQAGNCAGCDKRHQCNKRLSIHHGSAQCPQTAAPPPTRKQKGKGKGRGKGKA